MPTMIPLHICGPHRPDASRDQVKEYVSTPPGCRLENMLCALQPPTAEMELQLPRSKLRCAEYPRQLPAGKIRVGSILPATLDRKSTRLNSSHRCISYAVFC